VPANGSNTTSPGQVERRMQRRANSTGNGARCPPGARSAGGTVHTVEQSDGQTPTVSRQSLMSGGGRRSQPSRQATVTTS
jgi:hypothetical protein